MNQPSTKWCCAYLFLDGYGSGQEFVINGHFCANYTSLVQFSGNLDERIIFLHSSVLTINMCLWEEIVVQLLHRQCSQL